MHGDTSADALHDRNASTANAGPFRVGNLPSALVRLMLRNPILPILIVALPGFAIFVPFYATLGNFANLALASSILLLLSTGGALVMITGNIDLSVEGTLAFTSMTAAWLMVSRDAGGSGLLLAPWIAILVSLAIGIGLGAVNAFLVEGLGVNPFIVTIGMMLALKGAAAIPTQATTVYGLPEQYSWVGLNDLFGVSWVVIIAFVLCFVISLWLRNSVAGRHLYALGGSKAAAYENGVLPRRITTIAYCMSGALAAAAGWLNAARLNSASASAGDGITFMVFAAMIIGGISLSGGRGGLWGVLGGVILLTSIDNVMNLIALNPLYVNFVRGIVILLAVVLIVIRQKLAERLRIQEPAA
jgi:ribose/xylose/arabinose/galactoside ABC-type transport system permease subunit